jgi:hypothetical protein
MNENGSSTSDPAILAAKGDAKFASKRAKYVARLMRIRRRVAPLKSGKANGLEPNLAIVVNRVNAQALRCHGARGRRVNEEPLVADQVSKKSASGMEHGQLPSQKKHRLRRM